MANAIRMTKVSAIEIKIQYLYTVKKKRKRNYTDILLKRKQIASLYNKE